MISWHESTARDNCNLSKYDVDRILLELQNGNIFTIDQGDTGPIKTYTMIGLFKKRNIVYGIEHYLSNTARRSLLKSIKENN
jgi:hypothetical protein